MRKRWFVIGAIALAVGCGSVQAGEEGEWRHVNPSQTQEAELEASEAPTPKHEAPTEEAYYANCDEVRKDHPNGLSAGDPGYRLKLDRDKDGKACDA